MAIYTITHSCGHQVDHHGLARKKWRANGALHGQLESDALELDWAHIA